MASLSLVRACHPSRRVPPNEPLTPNADPTPVFNFKSSTRNSFLSPLNNSLYSFSPKPESPNQRPSFSLSALLGSDLDAQSKDHLDSESKNDLDPNATELSRKRLSELSSNYTKLEFMINSNSFEEARGVLEELIQFYEKENRRVGNEKFSLLIYAFSKLFRQEAKLETAETLKRFFDVGFDTEKAQKKFKFVKSINLACAELLADGPVSKFKKFVICLWSSKVYAFRIIGTAMHNGYLEGYCRNLLHHTQLDECIDFMEFLAEYKIRVSQIIKPTKIFSMCVNENKMDLGIRYIRMLPKSNSFYEEMIKEYGRKNELNCAYKLILCINDAQHASLDNFIYRLFIDFCYKEKNHALLFEFFEKMLDNVIQPNVYIYNSLMNANSSKTELLWEIYSHMIDLGVQPDNVTFNILLKSCALSGNTAAGLQLYHQLLRITDGTIVENNIESRKNNNGDNNINNVIDTSNPSDYESNLMDVITFTSVIQIFARARMWEEALGVKEEMEKRGIAPNVITYTALIAACAKAGMLDKAFQVFEEMIRKKCFPNTNTYNVLIDACANTGQVNRAFELQKEMQDGGRYNTSYDSGNESGTADELNYSNKASSSGATNRETGGTEKKIEKEENEEQRKERTKRNRRMDCLPDRITYHSLMKACAASPTRIRSVMEEMKKMNIKYNIRTWTILIDSFASNQDLNGALKVFQEMKSHGFHPDVIAYTSIIKACVISNDISKAFDVFDEMNDAGVKPNLITYNTLLRNNKNFGNFVWIKRAISLYHQMREAGYAPNDYLLKSLLEEWAEGAIENNENKRQSNKQRSQAASLTQDNSFQHFMDNNSLESMNYSREIRNENTEKNLGFNDDLISRFAFHDLENPNSDFFNVDVRKLSQMEARTTVLSVLRILKEKFQRVERDLMIIIGEENSTTVAKVRDSVTHVLQDQLRLPVRWLDSDNRDEVDHHSFFDSAIDHGDGHLTSPPLLFSPLSNMLSEDSPRSIEKDNDKFTNIALNDILIDTATKSNINSKANSTHLLFSRNYVAKKPSFPGKLLVPRDSLNQWLTKHRPLTS